jgi:hypothetical protein
MGSSDSPDISSQPIELPSFMITKYVLIAILSRRSGGPSGGPYTIESSALPVMGLS